MLWTVLIYLGVGYLELLILMQGNARARTWDKRRKSTHVFPFYNTTNIY